MVFGTCLLRRSDSGGVAYGLAFYEYPELRIDGGCMHRMLPAIRGLFVLFIGVDYTEAWYTGLQNSK